MLAVSENREQDLEQKLRLVMEAYAEMRSSYKTMQRMVEIWRPASEETAHKLSRLEIENTKLREQIRAETRRREDAEARCRAFKAALKENKR